MRSQEAVYGARFSAGRGWRRVGIWLALLLVAAGMALGPVAAQGPAGVPVMADLMGYGRLQMSVQSASPGTGAAVFACETPALADRLLSKLRADFTWDPLLVGKEITLAGKVPAYSVEGTGVIFFARQGSRVYVGAAPTPAAAETVVARLKLTGADTRFTPEKPHPASLDFFDLHPLHMGYGAFNTVGQPVAQWNDRFSRAELNKAPAFWAPYGIEVSIAGGGENFGFGAVGDGPMTTFPTTYLMDLAKSNGQEVGVWLGEGLAPWWLRNRMPEQIDQHDPNCIPAYAPLGCGGGTWLSFTASDEAFAYAEAFSQHFLDAVDKAGGDNLEYVRMYGGGRPGDELALHHYSTEFMDYGAAGQAGFRRWMRDERKLDLAALGQRWYGDPGHFRSWDEVMIPSYFEFFGVYGADTLNLLTGWQWRPDRKAADAEGWGARDYQPGPEWTPVDLAPSMRQTLLYNSQPDDATQRVGKTAWFRKEFDATDWLAKHPGKPVYLVVWTLDSQQEPEEVWVNGAYLGKIRPKVAYAGPIAMEVTGLVGPGRNTVALKVRAGIIYGPVFLTSEEPKRYPYLGPQANARWVDMRDWIATRMVKSWKHDAQLFRQMNPDTPLQLPTGGMVYSDEWGQMRRDWGLNCVHDTGGFAGSYSGYYAGLGYTQGIYMTSEEGGTMADEFGQSRQLAWFLFEGVAGHKWVNEPWKYAEFEQNTHWFTKNARLLQLVGKATRAKPEIALLHAASERYFPYTYAFASWDIGRGSLQAAHINNAYVTETEVLNGLVDQYPVLIDNNTSVMGEDLLAALERYVRAGGTFICLQNTGQSTLLDADTWPISKLSGFKVVGERNSAMVTVLKDNPLLKGMAGMKFTGSGMAVNWMGIDFARENPPVALAAAEAECVPIAKWEDGTIAIGMRNLGKGRVIVLGSTFWMSKSDLAGNGYGANGSVQTTFLIDLCNGLGIARDVTCNSEDVWARRMVTKNGLQDWFVLWNSSREAVDNVDLGFPLDHQPARVLDMESGQPVEFTYQDGQVHVAKFTMAPNGTRVFGVERGTGLDAATHWLEEKVRFDTKPHLPAGLKPFVAPPVTMPVLEKFQFRMADATAKTDLAWTKEPTNTAAWKEVGYGFWDEMGYPATGIGLYRTTFQVPAAWSGQRVLLAFASWDQPIFFWGYTPYVNGVKQVASCSGGQPPFTVFDLTAGVHPGANELGILVDGGGPRGGFTGNVFVYAQAPLHSALVLTEGWKLFSNDKDSTPATLPVKAKGRSLSIEVPVPAEWKGRDVYLDFTLGERDIMTVVVNGGAINYNWYGHPYPNVARVNLYPFLKPGEVNRIELWPGPGALVSDVDVVEATLGTLPREGRP